MVEELGRLLRDVELYRDQLTPEEPVRIGLRLTDTGKEATLGFGEGLTLEPGNAYCVLPGGPQGEDGERPDAPLVGQGHALLTIIFYD